MSNPTLGPMRLYSVWANTKLPSWKTLTVLTVVPRVRRTIRSRTPCTPSATSRSCWTNPVELRTSAGPSAPVSRLLSRATTCCSCVVIPALLVSSPGRGGVPDSAKGDQNTCSDHCGRGQMPAPAAGEDHQVPPLVEGLGKAAAAAGTAAGDDDGTARECHVLFSLNGKPVGGERNPHRYSSKWTLPFLLACGWSSWKLVIAHSRPRLDEAASLRPRQEVCIYIYYGKKISPPP